MVINLTMAFVSHSCNGLVLFLHSICTVQMDYVKKGWCDLLFCTVLFSHEKFCLQALLAEFVAVFLDGSQSHHDLIKADCFFKRATLFCFHINLKLDRLKCHDACNVHIVLLADMPLIKVINWNVYFHSTQSENGTVFSIQRSMKCSSLWIIV